jgi:hypothetical protein
MVKQEMIEVKERTLDAFILIILLLFGVYLSILYYGHQVVPDPDFTDFVKTGRQLLSWQLPDSYKRAPVLGILLVVLSNAVGGLHPELTAGWLLNAFILPLNLILLWFVGRKIVGWPAHWIALIAIINPYMLKMAMQPIAEMLLLLCILVSFFAIFQRSRWAYLAASITTMVRYEGALLILIVFVIDMLEREKMDSWYKPLFYAGLSSVPLCLWMLGTILNFQTQDSTHYLKEMGATSGGKILWVEYLHLIWRLGVQHLFETNVFAPTATTKIAYNLNKGLSFLIFIYGVGYGLFKHNWNILALTVFLSGYLLIHAWHGFMYFRFGVPVFWIVLLICVYGLINGWAWINRGNTIPEKAIYVLHVTAIVLITVWLFLLFLNVPETAYISRRSISVPYVFGVVAALLFFAQTLLCRPRHWLKNLTITLLVILIGFSNQFWLAKTVKDGKQDLEFKLLAEWYKENAKPGETMLSTMPSLIQIFAPANKDAFIPLGSISAENRDAFIEECYSKSIDYVVWDSRLGDRPDSRYGILLKIKRIEALEKPRNNGPFVFIEQIRVSKNQFINIFRLKERSQSSRLPLSEN